MSETTCGTIRPAIWSLSVLLLAILFVDGAQGKLTAESSTVAIQQKIKANEFLVVIFCDQELTEDECLADVRDITNQFKEEIASFPGIEAILTSDVQSADIHGVPDLPAVAFFRKGTPIFYSEVDVENYELVEWMEQHRSVHAQTLTDSTFEHDTQAATGATTGNWLVMFYDQECAESLALWERVAISLSQTTVVAKVDTASNPGMQQRFGEFTECPAIMMFSQGKMYEFEEDELTVKSLSVFGRSGYKEQEGSPVPDPVSSSVISAALSAVIALATSGSTAGLCMALSGGTLAVLLIVIIVLSKKRKRRAKFD